MSLIEIGNPSQSLENVCRWAFQAKAVTLASIILPTFLSLPFPPFSTEIPVAPGVEHYVLDTSLDEVYFALQ